MKNTKDIPKVLTPKEKRVNFRNRDKIIRDHPKMIKKPIEKYKEKNLFIIAYNKIKKEIRKMKK